MERMQHAAMACTWHRKLPHGSGVMALHGFMHMSRCGLNELCPLEYCPKDRTLALQYTVPVFEQVVIVLDRDFAWGT